MEHMYFALFIEFQMELFSVYQTFNVILNFKIFLPVRYFLSLFRESVCNLESFELDYVF